MASFFLVGGREGSGDRGKGVRFSRTKWTAIISREHRGGKWSLHCWRAQWRLSLSRRRRLDRFRRINGTRMNSLRYLPFAFICLSENTSVGEVGRGALRSALSLSLHLPPSTTQCYPHHHPPTTTTTPLTLPPLLSLCVHWTSTNSVLLYLFVYLLLSLFHFRGFLSETCKPLKPSGRGAAGLHLYQYVCACVCGFRRDWYKIKIQIERKHWNHHFLLSPAIQFLAPTVNQLLWGDETESAEMYSLHDSEYLLSNTINTWRRLQWVWNSFLGIRLEKHYCIQQ